MFALQGPLWQPMTKTEFLIIGGGVIGVCIARELRARYPSEKVILLEKESSAGQHASGRNSGVLHAGFYYTPDSLKAQFTRLGNQSMHTYCDVKGLRVNRCGKLVVAQDQSQLASLDELLRRGLANGVPLHLISAQEARAIEPRVKTFERALFSPTTSSLDPTEVMAAMTRDAVAEGVELRLGEAYVGKTGETVRSTRDAYQAKYVVNAAGLYADRVARDFGFSEHYRILPFKGLYLYSDEPIGAVRTHIYPVPDLRHPFLGVHYTLTVDGKVKIGPTAIPAFWREQYSGVDRFSGSEFFEIIARQAGLFLSSSFDFKTLALRELKKYSKAKMAAEAGELLTGVSAAQFFKWGKPGIRAQLLDLRKGKLEMDFVLEGDGRSMHVLNAVSPAFTCSIPFSRYVCDRIARQLK